MKQENFFETLHSMAVLPSIKRTCSTCIFFAKKGEAPAALCLVSLKAVNTDTDGCEDYEALKR